MSYIYLASPYTGCPNGTTWAYEQACRYAGEFLRQGLVIYSPIVHGHAITERFELPTPWEFWKGPSKTMLSGSKEVYVLELPGWEDSHGVTEERLWAKEMYIPVKGISLFMD